MKHLSFLLLVMIVISCSTQEKKCVLQGELINIDCDTLLLFKSSKFPVIEASIPVTDNHFQYELKFEQPEVYELVVQKDFQRGSMFYVEFFAEKGYVEFEIHPLENNKKNDISGSDLNNALVAYKRKLRELFQDKMMSYSDSIMQLSKTGNAYSVEWESVIERLSNEKDHEKRKPLFEERNYLRNTGLMHTPHARSFQNKIDSLDNELRLWEFNYISENISLLSYFLFMKDIRKTARMCCWKEVDIELIKDAEENLSRFALAIQGHPYEEIISNTLAGLNVIKEGGRFIDFIGTDFQGNNISVSSFIKENNLVLLDFWSTWCSSCLVKNRELVSIYNKYQDK